MGGYLTFAEVVAKLDSMRTQYPQFISTKFSIGTTWEGRTMWAVRITKNPDAPTGRPEVMYHALIHAREPESMETQMYYFYWLFENYGTNPEATYILNNRKSIGFRCLMLTVMSITILQIQQEAACGDLTGIFQPDNAVQQI